MKTGKHFWKTGSTLALILSWWLGLTATTQAQLPLRSLPRYTPLGFNSSNRFPGFNQHRFLQRGSQVAMCGPTQPGFSTPYMGMGMNPYMGMGMGMNPYMGMGMGMNPYMGMGMNPYMGMGMGMGMNPYMGMGMNPFQGMAMLKGPFASR